MECPIVQHDARACAHGIVRKDVVLGGVAGIVAQRCVPGQNCVATRPGLAISARGTNTVTACGGKSGCLGRDDPHLDAKLGDGARREHNATQQRAWT